MNLIDNFIKKSGLSYPKTKSALLFIKLNFYTLEKKYD